MEFMMPFFIILDFKLIYIYLCLCIEGLEIIIVVFYVFLDEIKKARMNSL